MKRQPLHFAFGLALAITASLALAGCGGAASVEGSYAHPSGLGSWELSEGNAVIKLNMFTYNVRGQQVIISSKVDREGAVCSVNQDGSLRCRDRSTGTPLTFRKVSTEPGVEGSYVGPNLVSPSDRYEFEGGEVTVAFDFATYTVSGKSVIFTSKENKEAFTCAWDRADSLVCPNKDTGAEETLNKIE
jgi:hypothetical protein